jgi:hypothetical protein
MLIICVVNCNAVRIHTGAWGSVVVKALRCQSEDLGIDLADPSGRAV